MTKLATGLLLIELVVDGGKICVKARQMGLIDGFPKVHEIDSRGFGWAPLTSRRLLHIQRFPCNPNGYLGCCIRHWNVVESLPRSSTMRHVQGQCLWNVTLAPRTAWLVGWLISRVHVWWCMPMYVVGGGDEQWFCYLVTSSCSCLLLFNPTKITSLEISIYNGLDSTHLGN